VLGAAALARNLGVSPLVIGLTIVGFGTSAPEMLVSSMASFSGNPGLGIGNAIGSNITNVALVLGVTSLLRPLRVHSKILRRELPVLLLTMVAAYVLMWHDNRLDLVDGLMLLGGMFLMVGWVVREGLAESGSDDALVDEFAEEVPLGMSSLVAIGWFALGLLALLGGSKLLVWGAVEVATYFGVPELIIGLTIVAIGTSLPELAASITAAMRGEDDIAVGNIVGSNMFNLLGVLALPGVIAPGPFEDAVVERDFPAMFLVTIGLLVMARGFGERGRLDRIEGGVLTLCFVGYLAMLFFGVGS